MDAGKENHLVQGVNWAGAAAYCDWMSMQAGLPRVYDHREWVRRQTGVYPTGPVTDPTGPGISPWHRFSA